jgi:hypothetical protein
MAIALCATPYFKNTNPSSKTPLKLLNFSRPISTGIWLNKQVQRRFCDQLIGCWKSLNSNF